MCRLCAEAVWTLAGTPSARLSNPRALAVQYNATSSSDLVYIVGDANSVQVLDVAKETITVYCGTGVSAFLDGACSTAKFGQLSGVAIVGSMMYVVDNTNILVRAINMNTSALLFCDDIVC